MLERIKYWSQRLLSQEAVVAPSARFVDMEVLSGRRSDPRELPRPRKPSLHSRRSSFSVVSIFPPREASEIIQCATESNGANPTKTVCTNCAELDMILECAVCLETLQGTGIYSCTFCGNSICWNCSLKVDKCPFCRSSLPYEKRIRNLAMERLVAKLALQCKNFRWGCRERLSQSERQDHERTCPFSRNVCPVQSCSWQGETALLVQHVKDAHQLTLLIGDSITIDISQFRAKMALSDKKTRKYCVSLFCYSNIFMCKIYLQKKTLRMVFMKVCCADSEVRSARRHFGASLDIRSSFKTLKGIMPISRCSKNAKELNVSCEGLLSPWKKTEENVKIAITIRPLS